MMQATLTLPGMAAIALTLGMAIDSNVLINERIREELRNGNTPQASINAGYEHAFGTILDSNITTLIAGIALFMFGSGPSTRFCSGVMSGHPDFDVQRGAGIACVGEFDLWTQAAVDQSSNRLERKDMEFFRIKQDIPFMSYGRYTTSISLVTFIVAVIFLSTRGLNFGVDFTGGTVLEMHYAQPAELSQVRDQLAGIGLKDALVQNFGTSHDVLIQVPLKQNTSGFEIERAGS